MKAMVQHEYGPPDVIHLEDIPKPIAGDDEVLVKVHAASANGDTALHRAVANGAVPAVRRLLERGADPHAKNVKGDSPLAVAAGVRTADAKSAILALLQAAPRP